MMLGPQEIVRSEVEGGLAGPANSLTAKSIDCGCGRFRLPRLARFATRRIFIALLCCIGVLQAASQAYLYVTSSTIARRFQLDPYLMEWIMCLSEMSMIIVGFIVAYWGDRIHRASWLGGLTLIQCATFLCLVIPHAAHSVRVTEETENVTHMSIYAEESPNLCITSSRLVVADNLPQYSVLFILIVVQIITAMASVAYFALGISYLDDNTKRIHAPVYISIILAIKVLGSILGYMLAWGFLRIDADNLSSIQSYSTQFGAWWLGWPIFAVLLAVPGFFMAIFPRKLPSEMVQETAASILDQSDTLRGSQRIPVKKVGSTQFFPSMLRLITNKIFIFNIHAAKFLVVAVVNFIANENIFLESRFYAPRPTGLLLGFGDPLISRTITTILKPLLIGLTVLIAGLVIARSKPAARTLAIYSIIVLAVSSIIIFLLALDDCQKSPINGAQKGSIHLGKYCNKDCHCSRDADFRPVCDSNGTFTFYSPCHAGCTSMRYENNIKVYDNCSCVEYTTGLGNVGARDGPCGSDTCQVGWIIYEIFTLLVYAAVSSTLIGDLLISLRSVNVQDKALTIGYSMATLGFSVYIPGKLVYDQLAKSTCLHWGLDDKICHLHHPTKLGNYLCFLTGALIMVSALLKIGVWFFAKDLEIYEPVETETPQESELKDISKTQTEPLLQPQASTAEDERDDNQAAEPVQSVVEPVVIEEIKKSIKENGSIDVVDEGEASGGQLRFGPLGPGIRRAAKTQSKASMLNASTDDDLDSSDGSHVPRKGSTSQVSYKPLEIDSDVESDLSNTMPRRRNRIPSIDNQEPTSPHDIHPPFSNIRFPNPDNYEDPRVSRSSRNNSPNTGADGSSTTSSFEYSKKRKDDKPLSASRGDFNEVGIPVLESYETTLKSSTSSLRSPTIMMALTTQLNRNLSQELLKETRFEFEPVRKKSSAEIEENRKFRLEKLMQPVNYIPVVLKPPSRDRASSGFGSSLPGDTSDSRDSISSKSSKSGPPKKQGYVCTDL